MNDNNTTEHLIDLCASFMDQMQRCASAEHGYELFADSLTRIIPVKTLTTFLFDTNKPAIIYSLQFCVETHTFQEHIPSYLSPSDTEMIWNMSSPSIISAYNLAIPEYRKKEIDFIIPLQSFSVKVGFIVLQLDKKHFTSLLSSAQKSILLLCNVFAQFLSHQTREKQIQTLHTAFEETKRYVSNCLENMVHGIITINTANIVSTFSSGAELLFEMERHQVLAKEYHTVFSPALCKTIDDIQQRISQHEYLIESECEYLMHGKYRIPIAISASQMQDANGAATGIILVCKDRSLMQRLIALEELRKIKSEFFSTASHEIKTPLNLILGSIGILADGIAGEVNEQQLRLINLIRDGGKRLHTLMLNLLDISKPDFTLDTRSERIHLQNLVRDNIIFHQNLAAQKGIVIQQNFHPDPLYITATREKLFKIIDNLISNALKYSPEESAVQVLIEPWKPAQQHSTIERFTAPSALEWIKIVVSDTGIGIPQEELPLIFTEFQRGSHQTVQTTEGTGLGLSIAKKITESLGGSITVESIVGEGSSFTVILPLDCAQNSNRIDSLLSAETSTKN